MSLSTFPFELAVRAAAVLGGELEASITVCQHGVTVRAGSSTGAAGRCDQVEAVTGSGPCIDAMQERSIRMVSSITEGQGWEAWRSQAAREGFVSAVAVPAAVDGNITVAVNLYSRSPAPWTPERVSTAENYAQLGAAMVRLHLGLAELDDAAVGYYLPAHVQRGSDRACDRRHHAGERLPRARGAVHPRVRVDGPWRVRTGGSRDHPACTGRYSRAIAHGPDRYPLATESCGARIVEPSRGTTPRSGSAGTGRPEVGSR